jgi:hypothetical protein
MSYAFKNNYILHIRSNEVTQLSDGFNTHMRVALDTNSIVVNENQEFRLSLHSANIPNTIYNVSKDTLNNFIIVDGTNHVIAAGFYSIFVLLDYLNDLSLGLTFEFVDTQSNVKITNTSVSAITLNFASTVPNSQGFCKLIGFTETDLNIQPSLSTTGTKVVNMTSVKTIYVYSSLSVANAVTTSVNNFQNIIATIPITSAPREIINFREDSKNFTNILNDQKVNIFTLTLKDQQGRLIQLNDSNYDLSFLLEIYEEQIVVTENRRSLVPENDPPLPITLDTPQIPDFPDDPPNLDEILEQADDIILPPSSPPILQTPTQPTQQRSQPIPISIKPPDYSSHELADVLLKAQYLKLKNLI